MSLLGEVVSTSAETVSLRLDIDKGHDPGGAYPYPWRPATGNLMYCMPQVGTRVSLYFPTLDERRAMVVNCVRTNGESCERMGDPSKRAFVTEHGKELTLHPEEMSLKGGIGQLLMSDADGIKLSSNGDIQIVGADIRFEAPTVTCSVPKGELIIAKMDAALETAESSFSMSNAYQVLSDSNTAIEGSDLETFEPYDDQLKEEEFDILGLLGNIAAGLAVVALVAFAVFAIVATGGLAAVGIGAAAAGSMATAAAIGGGVAVGMVALGDIGSGNVSDTWTYVFAGGGGAVAGAVFAGIGAFGQLLGSSCELLTKLGVLVKIIPAAANISAAITFGMLGFDVGALVAKIFLPNNDLSKLNAQLHSNAFYNGFQIAIGIFAAFTGGFSRGMRFAVCFVAGTPILTAAGLVAIENIRAGNKVISTNEETLETAEKTVLETYIRQSWSLVHIWIDGQKTSVTPNHPYWVSGKGWVEAGDLTGMEQLRNPDGNLVSIEKIEFEDLDAPITVYNFQVEDFHTYYVSETAVWVHNADYPVPNETTRVGRWMSQAEYQKMVETGRVQISADNKVHVANPANITAFGKQAPKGSIYVEFDVSTRTMSRGGAHGWGIINGPGSLLDRLYLKQGLPRITEMPTATNIQIMGSK